ncbi:hypothetical protein SteCoe_4456 [Stentor coeruleus]|uniref:Uncharacterized protein n=1 Tax=Stentor coeruleus TaxID=5963 RepID=A0A1R2CUP0_9CILI|nr:hypothetical protein SteCoe_4456 [Stentor coeruleus]
MNRYVVAAAGLGISAVILYYLSEEIPQGLCQSLKKDQTIQILKELLERSQEIFNKIAYTADKIKENSIKTPTPVQLKDMLFRDYSFASDIRNLEEEIYSKNFVTENDFKKALKEDFALDTDVMVFAEKMQNMLDSACRGIAINENSLIPYELTSAYGIKVIADCYICDLYLAHKKIELMKEYDYEEDEWELSDTLIAEENSSKGKIFAKHGFKIDPGNSNYIIRQTIMNFRKISKDFKESLTELERKYNKKIALVLSKTFPDKDLQKLKTKYMDLIS